MNQEQRKFLIDQVRRTFEKQEKKLVKPKPPSLNNYLVAAVLDGTIKYKSIAVLSSCVKKAVLALGPSDTFIKRESRWGSYDNDDEEPVLSMNPNVIFEYPKAYIEAEEEYKRLRDAYEAACEELANLRDTIIMKIQIGSNEVLSRIIQDVDNMGDLRIINTNLMLGEPKKQISYTDEDKRRRR